jgi:hypothetical protein
MDDWAIQIFSYAPNLFAQFVRIGREIYPKETNELMDEIIRMAAEKNTIQQPPQDESQITFKTNDDYVLHRQFYRAAVRQACALLRETDQEGKSG